MLFRSRDALVKMGIAEDHIHVPGLLNVTVTAQLLLLGTTVVQIAVGPHQPTLLVQYYLLFHTENFESLYIELGHYKLLMQGALGVFVYSDVHRQFVQEHYGVPENTVFFVPFYSHSPYLEEGWQEQTVDVYPYQVYFYGTNSVRRNEFETVISQFCEERNISFISTQMIQNSYFDPYDIRTKEWFLKNSRIVVSIHSGGPENRIVLEAHRINHLLSLGRLCS